METGTAKKSKLFLPFSHIDIKRKLLVVIFFLFSFLTALEKLTLLSWLCVDSFFDFLFKFFSSSSEFFFFSYGTIIDKAKVISNLFYDEITFTPTPHSKWDFSGLSIIGIRVIKKRNIYFFFFSFLVLFGIFILVYVLNYVMKDEILLVFCLVLNILLAFSHFLEFFY